MQGEEDALPSDIQLLKRQARAAFGNDRIFAASDFYTYPVSPSSFSVRVDTVQLMTVVTKSGEKS